jgi:hypothetical protein
VEHLGGSAGVKKAVDRLAKAPSLKKPKDFPNSVAANLNTASLIFATFVNINTTDGHSGTGWGAGAGAGAEFTGGILWYKSWDELMSEPNAFDIVSVEDGVLASFFIGGQIVATYFGAGAGVDVGISGGSFTWSTDDSNKGSD